MAYFHKNKNILYIGENESKYYTYDINTGILVGLKSTPISRIPHIFNTLQINKETPIYYKHIISGIKDSSINHPSELVLFIDKYYAMQNHISTTYTTLKALWRATDNEEFFKKEFNKYMKYCTKHNREVSYNSYQDYFKNERLSAYTKYLIYNDDLTALQKQLICERLLTVDTVAPRLNKLIAKIMSHPNYWEYSQVKYSCWSDKICLIHSNREPALSSRLLDDIISIYTYMPDLPLVKANTINEAYLQAQRLASSYVAEQEVRHKELYQSYLSKIKYEDENFTMILPTTAEELQREGAEQSNCVGGYYRYIADMQKFVVFIRDKKNVNKPLVTCDIDISKDKTLHIHQYLLSHNAYVTTEIPIYDYYNQDISKEVRKNLLIFKENFQKHLDKISIM